MDDEAFVEYVTRRLASLPAVRAVALGGSRACGTQRPESDWDMAVYYRGKFDPQDLRDLGWPGEVSEIGGWGGGVYNGGAWLTIDGRPVDVHYRDLDSVDREVAEARAGRVRFEPLMFHLAGIATYLIVAELAQNQVLYGELPRPDYPLALSRSAPPSWWSRADLLLWYAGAHHAAHGRVAQTIAMVTEAATCAAHAVLAAGSQWVTNEKTILARAGLDGIDRLVTDLPGDPDSLQALVVHVRILCSRAMRDSLRASGHPEAVEQLGLL